MGIEAGMWRPPDMSWMFPDPDQCLDIHLVVTPSVVEGATPRFNHWALNWTVRDIDGIIEIRRVHIVREIGHDHLTNWGPLTGATERTPQMVLILVCQLTLAERKILEHIAQNTEVMVPNGEWNCQDWLLTVFEKAIEAGIMKKADIDRATRRAYGVMPICERPC
ncbi:hypothetical protein BD779DRAFT_1440861 [Infundibulicybe gibba]|nr:hypothetical protein BD779DRAFT_1440861 [Infundibulicybe gibba]